MRIEEKKFDNLKIRRYFFKEGFIDITHSRSENIDPREVDRQRKTTRVITYA